MVGFATLNLREKMVLRARFLENMGLLWQLRIFLE
jgi:hypothetical protein